MSDSELDGFPVLDSNDLGNIPSVNYESNSQPPSVQIESQSSSAENLHSHKDNKNKFSKLSSPHLIPPSSIDLPSSPNNSNNEFQVAQQASNITSVEQKKDALDNYNNSFTQPLINENNQIDYGSLDQQVEEESCRRTCLKIFYGLCSCNCEDTIYTYTQPLNAEVEKMNSQFHHCFDSFFHNLCGCSEHIINE